MKSETEVSDDFEAHFMANAGHHLDPTLAWLKTFGVRFDFLPTYFITSSAPRMAPVGGTLALIEALADAAERHGGRILYDTTASQLLRDSAGRILGVRTVDRGGR